MAFPDPRIRLMKLSQTVLSPCGAMCDAQRTLHRALHSSHRGGMRQSLRAGVHGVRQGETPPPRGHSTSGYGARLIAALTTSAACFCVVGCASDPKWNANGRLLVMQLCGALPAEAKHSSAVPGGSALLGDTCCTKCCP